MARKQSFLLGAGVVLSFAIFALPLAHAESPLCALEPHLKELALALAGDKTKDELTIRKTLITTIITCAELDTENMAHALLDVDPPVNDLEVQASYILLQTHLEDAAVYYKNARLALDDKTLTIESTKALADELYKWRARTFLPLVQRITNFIMWTKNGDLVRTAERRLGQIEQTIRALKLTEDETVTLRAAQAKNNLQNAQSAYRRTRQIFVAALPQDDFPYLVRSSLESLSLVYKDFFDVGEAVDRALR